MGTIHNHPICRDLVFAGLCLGGSYLLGKKNQNSSSLFLNTGVTLTVCLYTQDKHPGIRICGPVFAALATASLTKQSFVKKHLAPLKVIHALALSSGVGATHALVEFLFRSNVKISQEYYESGLALLRQDKNEEAAAAFKKAIADIEEDLTGGIQYFLGDALLRQDKNEEAAAAFEKAIAAGIEEGSLGRAQYYLGNALLRQDKNEEAAAAFEKAIAADIEGRLLGMVQYFYGRSLLRQGNAEKAKIAFGEVITAYEEANAGNTVNLSLARALLGEGKNEKEAVDYAKDIKERGEFREFRRYVGEKFGYSLFAVGEDFLQLGHLREAKAFFAGAIEVYQGVEGLSEGKLERAQQGLADTLAKLRD